MARRRRLLLTAICLGIALVGLGGYWWYRVRLPRPPLVDTSGREPEVAAAITAAREQVLQEPRSGPAWGRLGMVLLAHVFQPEAEQCLARAAQLDPKQAKWVYFQGRIVELRDPEAALLLLRRAAELAQDTNVPRLHLAELLFTQGHVEEAEQEFHRVLGEEPDNPRAHYGLGCLLHGRSDLESAADHLRRAARAAPTLRGAHALLAEIYRRQGDRTSEERELALLQNSAELDWPDPYMDEMDTYLAGSAARLARADRLARRGRWEEAEQILRDVLQATPDLFAARLALAQRLAAMGQLSEAEEHFRAALKVRPDSFDALSDLALLLQKRGDYRAAVGCYERILARQPAHAAAHFHLANCREQLGDRAAAIESLRAALRCKPDFALAHKIFGRLLAENHDNAEAARQLQDALRLEPNDSETRELLKRLAAADPRKECPPKK
jgi:tetratricopeptide (TPR) repeat protein